MRTLALVAREAFRDTIRERQFHTIVGGFVLLALGITIVNGRSAVGDASLVAMLVPLFTLLVPLVGLGFFVSSIVNWRVTGALKLVAGLPIPRQTVVLGTFLGLSAVLSSALGGAVGLSTVAALIYGIAVDPIDLLGFLGLFVFLGVTFTALAVAISAIVRTTTRAMVGAFGAFVLFYFQLWAALPNAVLYVRYGLSIPDHTPAWIDLFAALNPMAAYAAAFEGLFPYSNGTLIRIPDSTAVYQEPPFALAVLAGWLVGSLAVASWQFGRTDL